MTSRISSVVPPTELDRFLRMMLVCTPVVVSLAVLNPLTRVPGLRRLVSLPRRAIVRLAWWAWMCRDAFDTDFDAYDHGMGFPIPFAEGPCSCHT